MKNEIEKIRNIVTNTDFIKGKTYPHYYIDYVGVEQSGNDNIFHFNVESERTYNIYKVRIKGIKNNISDVRCTCPQFMISNSCKHIAACLINYQDEIFNFDPKERLLNLSKDIIDKFKPNITKREIKKQVYLDIELVNYYNSYQLVLKMGIDRLYSVRNKLGKFFECYMENEGEVEFGKQFTYNPLKHFFNSEDKDILDLLFQYYSHRGNPYYANLNTSEITSDYIIKLMKLLKNKLFKFEGKQIIAIIDKFPYDVHLKKVENEYIFKIDGEDKTIALTSNYEYIIRDNICYHLTKKHQELLSVMLENRINQLVFEDTNLDSFVKGILPIFKDQIVLDDSVKDKVVISVKPECKLYFDFKKNIICNIKLKYNDNEIDYFDDTSIIVRDIDYENNIIDDLLEQGFIIDNKKIILDDIDKIGEFFEEGLEKLASIYDVYTSQKMKDTSIIKNNNIQSTFSIGKDNIMNFSFDLGSISTSELDNILDSVRNKKKYYKLKNGDLINIENDEKLKELENFMDTMNMNSNDIENGTIPKYRALYIDSLKSNYNIIKTDNLFDEFIKNFNEYKNSNLKLTKKEKDILRDYQEIGVKWLYNIYKCGFGCILADEMGLGKSIQIIYFIKKLIEEDNTSKFLIVVPTSLVYNWENEFKKFGSKLNYQVFAGMKAKRHESLKNDNPNIYITSYGLLREDEDIYKEINFKVCVIDEAQNIKNPQAGITKVVKKINSQTKIALTGTPIENSTIELWSIFDFIMPGFLASEQAFHRKYNIKDFDDDTNNKLSLLNKQISPFILRRKKQDVLKDLPDKIENNIYIELSEKQKKLYAAEVIRVRKEMDEIISKEGIEKARFLILQLLTKLRQMCIDPRLVFEDYNETSSKIENLIKVVKELIDNGHKILLFSTFKTAIDLVKKEFEKNNITSYVIDGSVQSKKRMELVDKFNSDDTNCFLITLKAGGTGLNLTSADIVIHLDIWWNPQAENQATDRAHRIGQKNVVEVIKLISTGTIEEKILELQNKKKLLSDKIIEGENRDQNMLSKLSAKDIKNLLSFENKDE